MPRLERAKLDQLTANALRIAGTTMGLLISTRCPYREEYQEIDGFVHQVSQLRAELGLPALKEGEVKESPRKPIGFRRNDT